MVAAITGVVFIVVVCSTNSLDTRRINWDMTEIVYGVNNSKPFNIYVNDFIYPLRPVGKTTVWGEIKRVLKIDKLHSQLKDIFHESKMLPDLARRR